LTESQIEQEKILRERAKKLELTRKENEALDDQIKEAKKMHDITVQQREMKQNELDEHKARIGKQEESQSALVV